MADIVPRDPFDLRNLRQTMDRLFDDSFFRLSTGPFMEEGTLPIDVSEKDGKVVVRASLPGFARDDIDVQVHEGVLSIKAQKTEESEEQGERFYRRERRVGAVSRRIALPGIVDEAAVDAELKNGVLTLQVPLPEKAKPKQIDIRSQD
ncbi:MAG: Hsp20 family protein [Dehalococcoidia bacterium]|nr:Hsp20 family protein [Dehalococcoidia bacterium]